jgi:hypothetical protein
MTKTLDQKGFTLFETTIFVTLSAMVLVESLLLFNSVMRTNSLIRGKDRLRQSAALVEAYIAERLAEADAVTAPASGSGSTLTMSSPDAADDPVSFTVSNGAMQLTLGAAAAVDLTPSYVTITDFTATRLTGSPPAVRLSIGYETDLSPTRSISSTSEFTVTLRYE